ncbi:hypothetical protein P152DRAFT_202114 [Eremomyces bilateralis CBS 781.70]|uniref:C3H1-type domain-containing protein n=1 Tax=Eremomyces bilateralis CBS 781.70 TaxID=1392243 RepID=A0A6G1GDH4_9PEZI|nr:uncharacterized protein P152DRAFT_202114 [Eremomyces bilateralis CBS 781.70]KAF1815919.1 hypothetical protein P152DRAFT_202114 [Eremomyces bilateralis CBS 781.70]
MMASKQKPCFEFQKHGRCRYRSNCRFSDGNARTQGPPREDEGFAKFREWRAMVPIYTGAFTNPLGRLLERFLADALKLVELDDGSRQEVITKLATDAGLCRVKKVV